MSTRWSLVAMSPLQWPWVRLPATHNDFRRDRVLTGTCLPDLSPSLPGEGGTLPRPGLREGGKRSPSAPHPSRLSRCYCIRKAVLDVFKVLWCKVYLCNIGWIKSSWTILNCNKTLKASHIATIFGQGIKQLFKICWCKFHFDDVNSDVTVASHVQVPIFSVQAVAARRNVLSRCWRAPG